MMCEKAESATERSSSLPEPLGRHPQSLPHALNKVWKCTVCFFSSEWVLTKLRKPNGSAAILLRTMMSSILLFLLVLLLVNSIDPNRDWRFSMTELRIQMAERIGWLGLIFGAVYTGLYARFSSQWTYLANLYNQIKQVEASTTQRNGMNKQAMAEWKAGFIEDAENLHLACKSSFVPIIRAWATDELVQEKYIEHTPGGKERLMRLMNEVAGIFDDLRKKQYRENQLRLPPFNPGKARGSTGRHL